MDNAWTIGHGDIESIYIRGSKHIVTLVTSHDAAANRILKTYKENIV